MPAWVIKWILPKVLDLAIDALRNMASKSDNTIDDKVVSLVAANRPKILKEIKRKI